MVAKEKTHKVHIGDLTIETSSGTSSFLRTGNGSEIRKKLRHALASRRPENHSADPDPTKTIKSAVILPSKDPCMAYFQIQPTDGSDRYKYGGIDLSRLPDKTKVILHFGKDRKVEFSIFANGVAEDGVVLKATSSNTDMYLFFEGSMGNDNTISPYYVGTNTSPIIKTKDGDVQLPKVNKIEIMYADKLIASVGQDYSIN